MNPSGPYSGNNPTSSPGFPGWISLMGLSSLFGGMFSSQSYLFDSARLLAIGFIIETGRRIYQWFFRRFRIQYSVTAQFDGNDPAYQWIVLFLTQEKIWRRSRDFRVTAVNSQRKWGVSPGLNDTIRGNAEYVPTYEMPQLFRWKGYWIEIWRHDAGAQPGIHHHHRNQAVGTIFITIYTLDMSVLPALVEEARLRYMEIGRTYITVHMTSAGHQFDPGHTWTHVKQKVRRPIGSIILQEGLMQSLLEDAREYLATADWYVEAGIPHRRGYLLYGPPGTGKSSTIHAVAGELGLEIYTLSLSSGFVDDSFLLRAISSTPQRSILLIEDIDCAFSSREDEDETLGQSGTMLDPHMMMMGPYIQRSKSNVTMSGLLNAIDGVGSEDGKLFFATTNHIDRLDPALLRPGRIDRKFEYKLATQAQAAALFHRFFPASRFGNHKSEVSEKIENNNNPSAMDELASTFASGIPDGEFSTADLQGYLLSCKTRPEQAASGVEAWVEQERQERKDRERRIDERKQKAKAKTADVNGK